MGIIKAFAGAVSGGLAEQWLEVIESGEMDDRTVMTSGIKVRPNDRRNSNTKGTDDVVTDGSIIHVNPDQFMILTDGGKVIDYTAEEGYYKVSNDSAPSLFNGSFGEAIKESFSRIKYSGVTPQKQKVYFINLQEIKGIKFGTRTPVNYFDNFYNAELFLRTHGTYSIKITDPLLFFREAVPRNDDTVDIDDINEQYLNEFLEALQAAINQMSADGVRISHVVSKGRELSKYMSDILDDDWKKNRGMEIRSVGIASISYDDESTKLINMRNQGAMLGDPTVREGYIQGAAARGIEAAGSNANGSFAGFMGVGMGMNTSGNFIGAASDANIKQMERNKSGETSDFNNAKWICECGTENRGNFCSQCGKKRKVKEKWTCECGTENTGNFCSECGKKRPEKIVCGKCGYEWENKTSVPKFCPECGDPINRDDYM